jgi:hypothetical protein
MPPQLPLLLPPLPLLLPMRPTAAAATADAAAAAADADACRYRRFAANPAAAADATAAANPQRKPRGQFPTTPPVLRKIGCHCMPAARLLPLLQICCPAADDTADATVLLPPLMHRSRCCCCRFAATDAARIDSAVARRR